MAPSQDADPFSSSDKSRELRDISLIVADKGDTCVFLALRRLLARPIPGVSSEICIDLIMESSLSGLHV